jgi:hypothetical protein
MTRDEQIKAVEGIISNNCFFEDKAEGFAYTIDARHTYKLARLLVDAIGLDEEEINKAMDKMYANQVSDISEFAMDRKIAKGLSQTKDIITIRSGDE